MGNRMTFNAIMDASQKYREDMEKEYSNDTFDSSDLETAFREGQLWFKDNLWHSPKERPEEKTIILFECEFDINPEYNFFDTTRIIDSTDYSEDFVKRYRILRWCYINDLI